jgi:hypothetical protein
MSNYHLFSGWQIMTTDNKSASDKLENGDARGDSNTATSHGGGIIGTNTTDDNRNSNDNLIKIELTRDLKDQEIVSNFIFDRKSKHLILSLNHKYRKKTIGSPVFQENWLKTTRRFMGQMELKGLSKDHANNLCDIVDNNYEKILDLNYNANVNERDDDKLQRKLKEVFIRKYTGNGTLPLHESVVITGQPSTFLHLVDHCKPQYTSTIKSANKIFYPSDTTDTQNPIPYIFGSAKELQEYLDLASKETFGSLHYKVETVYKKYVNIEEHCIVILAADAIYSYFQEKFGTTHYNIFIGDNGSGKNSALLVFRYLGYRVFYISAASAPNYFTFLGEIEEGQGTIAEDEADDIAYDEDKQRILKTGYCSGGTVPKVDLSNGRTQAAFLTFCHKWLAMESLPDYKKTKGILDRSFVYNFIIGDVPYNIKDVIQHAGDPKLKPLFDELKHTRKLLFAFRMIHYSDVIPDINLNIIHRNAELTKPLLRLFSYRNESPIALEKIRLALSKFIAKRNESKKNSIESKLRGTINNLINKRQVNPEAEEYKGLASCAFSNEQIFAEVKTLVDGIDVPLRSASFYSVEYGMLSHKSIIGLYKSKLKAEPFRIGSGSETRRGLSFSREVLDRVDAYYDVPNEIVIENTNTSRSDDINNSSSSRSNDNDADNNNDDLDSERPEQNNQTEEQESTPVKDANGTTMERAAIDATHSTHATDATHYGNRQAFKENISNDDITQTNENNLINSLDSSEYYNKAGIKTAEQKIATEKAFPYPRSVASVGSVADIKNHTDTTNIKTRDKTKEVGLPAIPCLFCNYKDPIDFDLSIHYLEKHKPELLRLPIGKGSMEKRADYAVELAKQKLLEAFEDEEEWE